jgi:hypothetical protein
MFPRNRKHPWRINMFSCTFAKSLPLFGGDFSFQETKANEGAEYE